MLISRPLSFGDTFTNGLASACSWTGRKPNIFTFCTSRKVPHPLYLKRKDKGQFAFIALLFGKYSPTNSLSASLKPPNFDKLLNMTNVSKTLHFVLVKFAFKQTKNCSRHFKPQCEYEVSNKDNFSD